MWGTLRGLRTEGDSPGTTTEASRPDGTVAFSARDQPAAVTAAPATDVLPVPRDSPVRVTAQDTARSPRGVETVADTDVTAGVRLKVAVRGEVSCKAGGGAATCG